MTSDLPAPFVPPDTDLRGYAYMPLKVAHLRDSDFSAIASDAEFRAGVMLWCAAWHQVPASSLPMDDKLLCRLAGLGRDLEAWIAVKKVALRGFEPCSDGRQYHPIIADLAIEAVKKQRRDAERTRLATEARLRRNVQRDVNVTSNVTRENPPDNGNVTSTKGEGEGDREERESEGREKRKEVRKNLVDAKPSTRDRDANLIAQWNSMAADLKIPCVQNPSPARLEALHRRLPDIGGPEGWPILLQKIKSSPHLTGNNDRGWTATFDWVLKPANLTKIMEGNYDDRKPNGHRPGSLASEFAKAEAVIDEHERRKANLARGAADGQADDDELPGLWESPR